MGVLFSLRAWKTPPRLGSVLLSRITVLLLAIALGVGMILWSRDNTRDLLAVHEPPLFHFNVTESVGDCGTPSIYILPKDMEGESRYFLLVDMLGGANRYPSLGGALAKPILTLPEPRRAGVGLGRSLFDRCERITIMMRSSFSAVNLVDAIGTQTLREPSAMQHVNVETVGDDLLQITYTKPEVRDGSLSLLGLELNGVRDVWQFGHKRVGFINEGNRGVNVYLYEEPDYLYLNAQLNPIRPLNVPRGYVDIHLESAGGAFSHTADVIRKSPTSELSLQDSLMTQSIVIGVGISLLVEGVLVLIITLAGRYQTVTET